MAITSHLGIGSFSRKALAMAIRSKIAWIADEKVLTVDYLQKITNTMFLRSQWTTCQSFL